MNSIITCKTITSRLMLTLACLVSFSAIHAANITVDGINYTTNATKKEATIAKYTIIKATDTTPADTLFYEGEIYRGRHSSQLISGLP